MKRILSVVFVLFIGLSMQAQDAKKAKELLGWEAQYDLAKMCESAWKFQQQNPKGYTL